MTVRRLGVYPGSFNPPTIGHEAIAAAARRAHDLDAVVVTLSHAPLAKAPVVRPTFEDRRAVLEAWADDVGWIEVAVTTDRLLVDIAEGFDVLVMGADKYHQIHEPHWYGGERERDAVLDRLPPLAVAPRPPLTVPDHLALELDPERLAGISSTRARDGDLDLMVDAARRFALASGAWMDDERYDAHLAAR